MKISYRHARDCLLAVVLAAVLQGCLYTSHHFNSGRILEPGNTAVTLGYGNMKLRAPDCEDYSYWTDTDSLGVTRCVRHTWDSIGGGRMDTTDIILRESSLPRFSLGYRLGVRGPWGPFTGVELGWHMEAPTNPGSVEFDMKFGLPNFKSPNFHHSLSGGWIVGMWADNSFFGEYAASRAFGPGSDAHALYFSYRLTRLATQPTEVFGTDSLSNSFMHNNRTAHQGTVGLQVRLPAWPVVPDYVSPQATFSTPWVPVFDDVAPEIPVIMNFNIGFGWRF